MILIENLIISDDIIEKDFVCNLNKCLGACCVEGESGAPLEEAELKILEQEFTNYKDYLHKTGLKSLDKQGLFVYDSDDDKFKTPLNPDGACSYAVKDKAGVWGCGIEKAYLEGKTSFRKPVSCHLYPIRINKVGENDALNYERWNVCKPACALGKTVGIPVYRFVKDALIRKYGEDVYNAIDQIAKENFNRTEPQA